MARTRRTTCIGLTERAFEELDELRDGGYEQSLSAFVERSIHERYAVMMARNLRFVRADELLKEAQ